MNSQYIAIFTVYSQYILQCRIKPLNNLIGGPGQGSGFDGAVGWLRRESRVRAAVAEGGMCRPGWPEGVEEWSEQQCFCARWALVKAPREYWCRAVGNAGWDQAQSLGVARCKALVYLGGFSLAWREQTFA